MTMQHGTWKLPRVVWLSALGLAMALVAAACGSTAGTTGTKRTEPTLVVGTNIGYPPFEQNDSSGQLVGFDVDIMDAVGAAMQTKVKFVNASFDSLIPSLAAGRYSAVISALTDDTAREKVVTFVDYFVAGSQAVVPAGNPHHITGLSSLCGLTVGVGAGSSEYTQAQAYSSTCTASGKPAIQLQTFANGVAAVTALESGRLDAALLDSGPAAYSVKTASGKLALGGAPYDESPYGIAVELSNKALANKIRTALKTMIENGTYHKLLVKWGVTGGGISAPAINDASMQ